MRWLCLLCLILSGVRDGVADDFKVERDAVSVFDSVMSPYCPGRTLSGCPSEQAQQLRGEVEGWLRAGENVSQVKTKLVQRFGEEILGMPKQSGLGILAWIVPIFFIFAGCLLIFFIIRKQPAVLVDSEGEVHGEY